MAECEVNSPVNRKGSKVGSGQAPVLILHVDAPTLFPRSRHMELAAAARNRES